MSEESGEADAALVHAFVRWRREKEFRLLYRRHAPALLLFVLRLLGGWRSSAEEAVQETWVRAVRAIDSFRGESAFRTWLFSIAVNCCREMNRESERFDGEAPEASIEEDPALRMDLERALRALPPGCREVFVLHDVEGWTHEEIALRLGIVAGTSKSQLHYARELLRASLGRKAHGT